MFVTVEGYMMMCVWRKEQLSPQSPFCPLDLASDAVLTDNI